MERDGRSQHRQPKEQGRRQLVRPDDRIMEGVARNNATQQHENFKKQEYRRWDGDEPSQRVVDLFQPSRAVCGNGQTFEMHLIAPRWPSNSALDNGNQASDPEYFSRIVQASAPYFCFQSA